MAAASRQPGAEAPTRAIRTAQCLMLATALWSGAWMLHLAAIRLPKQRASAPYSTRLASATTARPKRPRSAMVIDGVVVPVAAQKREALVLPTREALLAEGQFTIVVAARVDDTNSFARFGSLVHSLAVFCEAPAVAELLVMAPAADRPRVEAHDAVQALPFPLRVVEDGVLLSRSEAYFRKYTPKAEWKEHGGRGVNCVER